MFIIYKELKNQPKVDIEKPLIGLISANHWFINSFEERSVYFGYWVVYQNIFFKLIEKININEEIKLIEIINEKQVNLICSSKAIISIYLDSQGLNIKTNYPIFIMIELDNRKLYETIINSENFKVIPQEKSFTIINDYGINFNIFYEGNLKFVNRKIKVIYDYDKKRNSSFFQNEITQAFEGYINHLKIFSTDKKADYLMNLSKKFIVKRILSLYNFDSGFRAGLPWFPQKWYRDELISFLFFNLGTIKDRVINYYLENLEKIWQFNKKENPVLSADTLLLLINNLDKEKINSEKSRLLNFLDNWIKIFKIYNDDLLPNSTWMDTLERKRAIEIDFLYYLSLIKLGLFNEAKKFKFYIKNKIYFKKYPQEEFLRPNLFFCYYLDKNFFDLDEWENFFDNLIKNNYLNWGGFSSLSINHSNFQRNYTGENSLSYHQGDSWFWLNNLAYFSLRDLNYNKYKIYLKNIKKAVLRNFLQMGVPGYISELSSAEKLTYEGSPIQLWSLVTLFYNLKRKGKKENGGRSSIG